MVANAKDIGRSFPPLQVGSIVDCVEPLSSGSDAGWALQLLEERPDLEVVPIEKDGIVVGVLSRRALAEIAGSAWKRFWQRDLDSYVTPARRSAEATDYVDLLVERDLAHAEKDDPGWYVVTHRRSYLGIVNVRTMLEHLNALRSLDLRRAGEMQRHLLRKEGIDGGRISVEFFNRMAHEIGGDFYRCAPIGKDRLLAACFDVAGKNISGALAASALGAFFSSFRLFSYSGDPRLTTGILNALVRDINPGDVFVAAILLYVDFAAGEVEIHNCGFSPALAFVPKEDRKIACRMARPNLPPLGIEEKLAIDSPLVVKIQRGLRLAAFSDGLTDMVDPFGERYGEDRAIALLRDLQKADPADAPSRIGAAVDAWIGTAHLSDDVTVIDLRFL